jgi:hypothetical protein
MNHEIIAKDSAGIKRCYGFGATHTEAMNHCRLVCLEYMADRKDIDILYLYYGCDERPVIRHENESVKREQS